jgi:hypothetical protein
VIDTYLLEKIEKIRETSEERVPKIRLKGDQITKKNAIGR